MVEALLLGLIAAAHVHDDGGPVDLRGVAAADDGHGLKFLEALQHGAGHHLRGNIPYDMSLDRFIYKGVLV